MKQRSGLEWTILFSSMLFLVFGALIWSGTLGFADSFLSIYGGVMFFLGTLMLTYYSYFNKTGKMIISVITTACIMTVLFCFFAMFGAIPGLKNSLAYGIIALPFIAVGGTTTTVERISVKRKNKNGFIETQTYTVTTKKTAFGDEVEIKRTK